MLLRCSAAFAIMSHRQAAGDEEALRFPPLQQRGSEFFVRSSVRVMDEAGLDRAAMVRAMNREAQDLVESGSLAGVMPACLQALEAAGL